MTITSIDSTNSTVTSSTNWQIPISGGFSNLEVANIGGGGILSVKVGYDTNVTVAANGADSWLIPATVGAARRWTWDVSDPNVPAAKYVAVIASASTQVAITEW